MRSHVKLCTSRDNAARGHLHAARQPDFSPYAGGCVRLGVDQGSHFAGILQLACVQISSFRLEDTSVSSSLEILFRSCNARGAEKIRRSAEWKFGYCAGSFASACSLFFCLKIVECLEGTKGA